MGKSLLNSAVPIVALSAFSFVVDADVAVLRLPRRHSSRAAALRLHRLFVSKKEEYHGAVNDAWRRKSESHHASLSFRVCSLISRAFSFSLRASERKNWRREEKKRKRREEKRREEKKIDLACESEEKNSRSTLGFSSNDANEKQPSDQSQTQPRHSLHPFVSSLELVIAFHKCHNVFFVRAKK
jgi:hypothetical protein